MSESKDFGQFVKSLPDIDKTSGTDIPIVKRDGSLAKIDGVNLVRVYKSRTSQSNKVLRVRNITSILISARGTMAERCALVWVSAYNQGTYIRCSAIPIYNNSGYYSWYINGSSDTNATLYIRANAESEGDDFHIVSLFGEQPELSLINEVPSDATPLF